MTVLLLIIYATVENKDENYYNKRYYIFGIDYDI